MELDSALTFARSTHASVFVTIKSSGRPQLSNVSHTIDDAGLIRISIATDRAKYRNLLREPWSALHITSADFWRYVVIEGTTELSAPAADAHDATVDELVEYYRSVSGEHPDWDEYRQAMVDQVRVVARFHPERAYGQLPAG
jgi:PPOX class probable F420-dependent enzyme